MGINLIVYSFSESRKQRKKNKRNKPQPSAVSPSSKKRRSELDKLLEAGLSSFHCETAKEAADRYVDQFLNDHPVFRQNILNWVILSTQILGNITFNFQYLPTPLNLVVLEKENSEMWKSLADYDAFFNFGWLLLHTGIKVMLKVF